MTPEIILAIVGAIVSLLTGAGAGIGIMWKYFTKELDKRDTLINNLYKELSDVKNRLGYLEGKQDSETIIKDTLKAIYDRIDQMPSKKQLKS